MSAITFSAPVVYVIDLNTVGRCGAGPDCTRTYAEGNQPVTPVGGWCLAEDEDGALWSAEVIEVTRSHYYDFDWMTLRLDHRIDDPTMPSFGAGTYVRLVSS